MDPPDPPDPPRGGGRDPRGGPGGSDPCAHVRPCQGRVGGGLRPPLPPLTGGSGNPRFQGLDPGKFHVVEYLDFGVYPETPKNHNVWVENVFFTGSTIGGRVVDPTCRILRVRFRGARCCEHPTGPPGVLMLHGGSPNLPSERGSEIRHPSGRGIEQFTESGTPTGVLVPPG